jgi:hypothetical protein
MPAGPTQAVEAEMRGFILAALLAIGAVYVASQIQTVSPWARNFCGYVGDSCDNPRWLMIAAAVLILLYVLLRK